MSINKHDEQPSYYPAEACAAWRLKWDNPFPSWRAPSVGLEPYAAFVRGWGFRMYGGFGWELVDPDLCANFESEARGENEYK